MSSAQGWEVYDRCIAELNRVWEASDRFDGKMAQFAGIVSAGALAAAGLLVPRFPGIVHQLPGVAEVLALAGLALVVFELAVLSALILEFKGPIDPREIAKSPDLLEDGARFRKASLPAVAKAFDSCICSHEKKAKRFRIAIGALATATVLVSVGSGVALIESYGKGGSISGVAGEMAPDLRRSPHMMSRARAGSKGGDTVQAGAPPGEEGKR